MHIFLAVLAKIGIALLIVLLVALILLLCILFTPICYKGKVAKKAEEELICNIRACFLFRLLYFKLDLIDKKPVYELYVLGIPLLSILKKKKAKKQEVKAQDKSENNKTESSDDSDDLPLKIEAVETQNKAESVQDEQQVEKQSSDVRLLKEKKDPFKKIKAFIKGLKAKKKSGKSKKEGLLEKIKAVKKLITSEQFKPAIGKVLKEVKALLLHILPKRIDGHVYFGFDSPATTGEVFGLAAWVYPMLPGKLQVVPDFENKMFDADVTFRGRIFVIVLLIRIIKVIADHNVRYVIKEVKTMRHKEA